MSCLLDLPFLYSFIPRHLFLLTGSPFQHFPSLLTFSFLSFFSPFHSHAMLSDLPFFLIVPVPFPSFLTMSPLSLVFLFSSFLISNRPPPCCSFSLYFQLLSALLSIEFLLYLSLPFVLVICFCFLFLFFLILGHSPLLFLSPLFQLLSYLLPIECLLTSLSAL